MNLNRLLLLMTMLVSIVFSNDIGALSFRVFILGISSATLCDSTGLTGGP